MEAMQAQTVDIVKRMKEITLVMKTPEQELENQGVTPADIEGIQYITINEMQDWQKLKCILFYFIYM